MIDWAFKFMLHKGIKYIPAIVYTAYKLKQSYERPEYFTSLDALISLTD